MTDPFIHVGPVEFLCNFCLPAVPEGSVVSCVPCCCSGLPIPWGCAAGCPLPPGLGPKRGGALSTATGSLSGHQRGKSGCPSSPSAPSPLGTLLCRKQAVSPGPGGHLVFSLTAGPELGAGPSLSRPTWGMSRHWPLRPPLGPAVGPAASPGTRLWALSSAHLRCMHSGSDVTPRCGGWGA